METPQRTEDFIMEAQRDLREALIQKKLQVIEEILVKHPELVNHEYDEEDGYSGTPLLISCDSIKSSDYLGPKRNGGVYHT